MSEGDHRWPQAAVAWSGAWITSQRLGWIEVVKASDPSCKTSGQCQGPQLCIKEFPQRWKVVKQIKYLLKGKKSTIPVDRHTGRLRERVATLQQFELLSWSISYGLPLASHSELPGTQSIFGISQVRNGFPVNSAGKESACNVDELSSIRELGRSPGGGHGNPLQYSCLKNLHGQRNLAGYSPWS